MRKNAALQQLGVWRAIDRHSEDFVAVIQTLTGKAAWMWCWITSAATTLRATSACWQRAAARQPRLYAAGHGGDRFTADHAQRLKPDLFHAATESAAEKARLAQCVRAHLLPLLAAGRIMPQVHQRLPLTAAAQAHRILEANANIGKVLLLPDAEAMP